MIRFHGMSRVALAMVMALVPAGAHAAADPAHESGHTPSAIDLGRNTLGRQRERREAAPAGSRSSGHFRVHAAPAVAWSVLTNYDSIQNFVSSVRESRITERGDGYILRGAGRRRPTALL